VTIDSLTTKKGEFTAEMVARLMNVFIDTSIVNYMLELNKPRPNDTTWQDNIKYIEQLINGPVANGDIIFYVNPSVNSQINNTKNKKRKMVLLSKFKEFKFKEFNVTIFPFRFPATFISKKQSTMLNDLCTKHPALSNDRKIIADSAFNKNIDVLLTTDTNLAHQVKHLDGVKFMLPKELWDLYQVTN
jgi:hypothetical protein